MGNPADEREDGLRTGHVEGDVPEAGILRLTYRGFITGPLVARSEALARELLAGGAARVVIFDTMPMKGFDATVRGPGVSLFRLMKEAKLDLGLIATESTAAKLTGTAFGIAARFPLAFVKSSGEALARAREAVRAGGDG